MASLCITASYAFVPIPEAMLASLQREITTFGTTRGMRGLILIATEGINATVSGPADAIAEWKTFLIGRFGDITFKDSGADREVFRRWSVKIKPEIVNLKDPSVHPNGKHRHLSPEEWREVLTKEDVIVIDARNAFEVAIGKFRGAVDPGTRSFHEFPAFVRNAALPKDKKILMYCTGGIRCEKAMYAMQKEGYENVYQLDGGILAYLEKFPDAEFEGECFVFDHRVSVDQHLRPSQLYGLCPHCGDPGDLLIHCGCGTDQKICTKCAEDAAKHTCSKWCAQEKRQGLIGV